MVTRFSVCLGDYALRTSVCNKIDECNVLIRGGECVDEIVNTFILAFDQAVEVADYEDGIHYMRIGVMTNYNYLVDVTFNDDVDYQTLLRDVVYVLKQLLQSGLRDKESGLNAS